jgi:excisionase family DNA binding protein
MKTQPVVEVWLSLEQASQLLGLPWSTVWRWAQSGDPRLPAYRVWDESTPKHGGYRFKKQDVDAFQTQTQEPTLAHAK